jgi:predicted O-methyltransferase YrrM
MNRMRALGNYLNYYFRASTRYDIHSPFVFELLTRVIENKVKSPVFEPIETLRKQLKQSQDEIEVIDLGAGSVHLKGSRRKIRDVVNYSAKSPKYAQLLYRLCNHFLPGEILELGTSLGISTLYLHAGNPQANLHTLEGGPEIADRARQHFFLLHAPEIQISVGPFEETLKACLQKGKKADFVFFDGNHRKAPTLEYFQMCLGNSHAQSVFVFDDIHWTTEMEEAWEEIKKHPSVTLTIDLHFLGLVFFMGGLEKQHFTVRF